MQVIFVLTKNRTKIEKEATKKIKSEN